MCAGYSYQSINIFPNSHGNEIFTGRFSYTIDEKISLKLIQNNNGTFYETHWKRRAIHSRAILHDIIQHYNKNVAINWAEAVFNIFSINLWRADNNKTSFNIVGHASAKKKTNSQCELIKPLCLNLPYFLCV